jgi:hypothetical protein
MRSWARPGGVQKQAARAAKKARKAELMAMRAEKEAPERAAKAERRKLKELKHEARLKHLCLDYVQVRCVRSRWCES